MNTMKMEDIPLHWQINDNVLVRTFIFDHFAQCVEFVSRILPLAEAAQHHPDIEIFSYKHVRVALTTHDQGKVITQKDIDLAEKINELPEAKSAL